MCFWKFLPKFVSMKTSIDFLPQRKQNDLHELVRLIRDEVKDCVMVILYGSYAKNTYVECDERRDFGVKTYFMSDYDILVVTKRRLGVREGTVETRIRERFLENRTDEFQTWPQLINESISKLNDTLSEGRYFYVEIQTQGIMLYDSGEYELAAPRELDYAEVQRMAQEYYDDKFPDAERFYYHSQIDYRDKAYLFASFHLHQAAEHFLKAIPLVHILYGYKEHDIDYLIKKCKPFTMELAKVFPRDTEEEERLFKLLQRAYIEARYNKKNFIVTKADIDALIPKIELLRNITEKVCKERIADYQVQSTK